MHTKELCHGTNGQQKGPLKYLNVYCLTYDLQTRIKVVIRMTKINNNEAKKSYNEKQTM